MALTVEDMLDTIRFSRRHFLKHILGLSAHQWDWKPYPECKSAVETLAHLIADDRAELESLRTGGEPDYDGLQELERDPQRLLEILSDTHIRLMETFQTKFEGAPLDTECSVWGTKRKLGAALAYLSSEDYYHAGQIAYIRMATDPSWDYYSTIYGGD